MRATRSHVGVRHGGLPQDAECVKTLIIAEQQQDVGTTFRHDAGLSALRPVGPPLRFSESIPPILTASVVQPDIPFRSSSKTATSTSPPGNRRYEDKTPTARACSSAQPAGLWFVGYGNVNDRALEPALAAGLNRRPEQCIPLLAIGIVRQKLQHRYMRAARLIRRRQVCQA